MQRTKDDILGFRIKTLICILLVNNPTQAIYRALLPYVSPNPRTGPLLRHIFSQEVFPFTGLSHSSQHIYLGIKNSLHQMNCTLLFNVSILNPWSVLR